MGNFSLTEGALLLPLQFFLYPRTTKKYLIFCKLSLAKKQEGERGAEKRHRDNFSFVFS